MAPPGPDPLPPPLAPLDPNVTLAAYRLGSFVARTLPGPAAEAAGRMIGIGLGSADAERRRMMGRHLQRVHGGTLSPLALRRMVQRSFDSYARYWVESFRLPDLSPAEIDAGMSVDGLGNVFDGLDRGNGVILALPHLGGWEWGGMWLALVHELPVTVVVEPLEPPELFDWFVEFRRSLGMTVVPVGPDAGKAVLRALHDNEVVCLLSDRDLTGSGTEVEFFGERTTLPSGPATLALRTGAALLPTAVYFEGRNGHLGLVRRPLDATRTGKLRDDVARLTQELAHALEALIRRAPDQWHLMQPNWPSDHD